METKICKVCGQMLPVSEFKKTKMSPNGIDTCNKCCAKKSSESRTKNRLGDEVGSGNTELSRFHSRELIEELRRRNYKGELYVIQKVVI